VIVTCNSTGAFSVSATRNDIPSVSQTFTGSCDERRTLDIDSGDGQSAMVGQSLPGPLVVLAQRDGVAQGSIGIDWAVVSGGISLGTAQTFTGGDGRTSVIVTCNSTGAFSVSATRNDIATVSQTFTGSCTAAISLVSIAVSPSSASIDIGDSQAFTATGTYSDASTADLTATATWTSSDTGVASMSGNTANALATGTTTITATSGTVSGTATLDVTTPTLIALQPNWQGLPGSPGDGPLEARLLDGQGDPIAGAIISWSVIANPGSVNLSGASSSTDAFGDASMPFDFGNSIGTATVRASALGGSVTADFSIEVGAGSLFITGGDGQTGDPGETLPIPLQVQVVDPFVGSLLSTGGSRPGKPAALSGVPVTFTVSGGGGSLSVTSATTDASGYASTSYTLGATPGANSVTASIPGGASVTFSLTTAATAVPVISIVSGDNQTLDPAVPSAPLVVQVIDSTSTLPMPGVTVNWTGTNASVSAASSVTDATGKASVTATLSGPGAASVDASLAPPASGSVQFALSSGLANLPGLSQTQAAVAEALDNACAAIAALPSPTPAQLDLLAQCDALIDSYALDPDATLDALDELLNRVTIAQANAALLAAQAQFDTLKARIAALRSGTQGTSFGGLAIASPVGNIPLPGLASLLLGEPAAEEAGAEFSRWGFYAAGTIGRGEAEPGSVNPAYDFDINGLTLGADYRYSDQLIFGAALGYTRQDTDLRDQEGSLDMSGWSLSLYSTMYRENSWYLDGVLTYGRNDYDLVRRVVYSLPLPGGGSMDVDQVADSNTSGNHLAAAFTFGRDFERGPWAFGPYARLMYTRLSFASIEEILAPGAGSGLGLLIESRDLVSLTSVIGGKLTRTFSTDWGVVIPHLQLEWEHEFEDSPDAFTARFLNDPTGTPISVEADPLDTDYFRVGIGLSMVLAQGRSGFAYYEHLLGRDGLSQGNFALGLRIEF
jgi:outer membrane autotransporter protein